LCHLVNTFQINHLNNGTGIECHDISPVNGFYAVYSEVYAETCSLVVATLPENSDFYLHPSGPHYFLYLLPDLCADQ